MVVAMTRTADYPVDPMFLERWSPRAFDGRTITKDELFTIFEAGRWAPSSSNIQPWRFIYAFRDTPAWSTLFGLLIPYNQQWVKNCAALVFVVSQNDTPPDRNGVVKPSYTHSFDAGAAWAMIALQASKMGLRAHGMAGFDIPRAAIDLKVPDTFRVEMAFAVGHATTDLSVIPETLRAKESPNDRKPVGELAFEGLFPATK